MIFLDGLAVELRSEDSQFSKNAWNDMLVAKNYAWSCEVKLLVNTHTIQHTTKYNIQVLYFTIFMPLHF